MHTQWLTCPLGLVKIVGDEQGVQVISCLDAPSAPGEEAHRVNTLKDKAPTPVLACIHQLQEYFSGQRQQFNLLLNPQGTPFQQRVWQALLEVPFGKTRSYLAQSRLLGNEKAIRAVAAANGKNPLWIVVPCHRIIGTNGALTGYAGGLWRKQWLLEHEGALPKGLF